MPKWSQKILGYKSQSNFTHAKHWTTIKIIMTKWKIRGKDKRQKKRQHKQSTNLGKSNARTKLAFFNEFKGKIIIYD